MDRCSLGLHSFHSETETVIKEIGIVGGVNYDEITYDCCSRCGYRKKVKTEPRGNIAMSWEKAWQEKGYPPKHEIVSILWGWGRLWALGPTDFDVMAYVDQTVFMPEVGIVSESQLVKTNGPFEVLFLNEYRNLCPIMFPVRRVIHLNDTVEVIGDTGSKVFSVKDVQSFREFVDHFNAYRNVQAIW